MAVLAMLASGPATPAQAQDLPDPSETARFRLGALRFTPSITVTNLGIDDNVFNEAENPKRDTTAAIGPALALWLKLGRGRLSGKTAGQYLYFQEFQNQRAWNTKNEIRLELPLARLKPFVGGDYTNTRERPGFEIDARARRADQTVLAGTELRVGGKTTLVVSGSQTHLVYNKDETFLGQTLADLLDRRTTTEQFQTRYALTPLTTFVATAEAIQDRFVTDKTRDADSLRVMPGFEFKPFALVSGKVALGFRHLNVLSDRTPDFNGFVASVNARYAVAATQIQGRFDRDITYSFELDTPYYALSDFEMTVIEQITRRWDVLARGGWQSLAYRNRVELATAGDRVDRGTIYGGGMGYRVGEAVRLGFDANYYRRNSSSDGRRSYEGLRMGASVNYGIEQ